MTARKRASLSRSACSARLCAVMSRTMVETPEMSPFAPRKGDTVIDAWNSSPPRRWRSVS